jgi:hypothetical protein
VPQTWVDSVVFEAIRQAAGNVGGVKLAGNIGVEPHAAATVHKSVGAIVQRAGAVVDHLAGENALVTGGNVLVQPDAVGNVLVRSPHHWAQSLRLVSKS